MRAFSYTICRYSVIPNIDILLYHLWNPNSLSYSKTVQTEYNTPRCSDKYTPSINSYLSSTNTKGISSHSASKTEERPEIPFICNSMIDFLKQIAIL